MLTRQLKRYYCQEISGIKGNIADVEVAENGYIISGQLNKRTQQVENPQQLKILQSVSTAYTSPPDEASRIAVSRE